VSGDLPGFSEHDENGNWSGIDADVCRAIAAAVFGRPGKVKYVPLSARDRFTSLQSGKIDVLSRNTTWTLSRDADGLEFAAVTFYDGQAIMVRRDLGIDSILDLDGAAVCVTKGTTTEVNLNDYFRINEMTYSAVKYQPYEKVTDAYEAGECEAITADQSALFAHRTTMEDPNAHIILPTIMSREPLGPVVCQSKCEGASDDRWEAVIRWTLNAMLEAEVRNVNSNNVDKLRATSKDPSVLRLLGVEGKLGEKLGLSNEWAYNMAYNIIKLVGNYAEVYDRNLGPDTLVNIPRGLNALWTDGGIHFPLPVL
jgi:general L-amino acid transport system substrate-binding protein